MTTTSTASALSFDTLSDAVIETMTSMTFSGSQPALRDSNGNLREMTADEEAFRAAIRAEAVRRGLR